MKSRKFTKEKKSQDIDVGDIIIAAPFWQDLRYRQSVIILLNHDNVGSTGIILNKQTTLSVKEALPAITKKLPLYYGGPFDTHTVSFIHTNPEVPEAVNLGNELFWGGDFDYLGQMIRDKQMDMEKIKFFAGFVEWSNGQLEAEISENKWWKSELTSHEVLTTSSENLWSHELIINGHVYGMVHDLPDPSLN